MIGRPRVPQRSCVCKLLCGRSLRDSSRASPVILFRLRHYLRNGAQKFKRIFPNCRHRRPLRGTIGAVATNAGYSAQDAGHNPGQRRRGSAARNGVRRPTNTLTFTGCRVIFGCFSGTYGQDWADHPAGAARRPGLFVVLFRGASFARFGPVFIHSQSSQFTEVSQEWRRLRISATA